MVDHLLQIYKFWASEKPREPSTQKIPCCLLILYPNILLNMSAKTNLILEFSSVLRINCVA